MVTQYLGQQPHIMKASGVPQELLDEIGQVLTWPATHDEVVAASRLVPDEIVQRCTASGEPDEVVAKVAEYVASGCTCPILYPLGPDVGLMLDTFAGGLDLSADESQSPTHDDQARSRHEAFAERHRRRGRRPDVAASRPARSSRSSAARARARRRRCA